MTASRARPRVRAATSGDGPAIGLVQVRGWQRAYRGVIPDAFLDGLDPAGAGARWARSAARLGPGRHLLVAVRSLGDSRERVLGFAAAGPPREAEPGGDGYAELYAIYVDPDEWGRGGGGALLRALLEELPATSGVLLWVLEDNPRARGFYERFGFVADGARRVESFAGAAVEEVRYRREATSGGSGPGRNGH